MRLISFSCFKATNEVLTRVPESTPDEMAAAVNSCKKAFKDWSQTTVLTRQQMMFKYQQLIKDNMVGDQSVKLGYKKTCLNQGHSEAIKLFSCSALLSMKIKLLIKTKMAKVRGDFKFK